jgi:hypothetical protein
MKELIGLLLLIGTFIQRVEAQVPSNTIQFEERVYNFGTIEEKKGKVSHIFVFQNKGKSAVEIDEVNSACGCIGKVVTTGPVKPGGKGKVTITFDPAYKSGFFSKEIVVITKKGQEYNRIWVEGKIQPMEHPVKDDYPYNFGSGLHLRLKVIAFGFLKPEETKEVELHYANDTDKEMVLAFRSEGTQPGLRFSNPGKIPAKARGVISFSYTMPADASKNVNLRLYPYVNDKKLNQSIGLEIRHFNNKNQRLTPKPHLQ